MLIVSKNPNEGALKNGQSLPTHDSKTKLKRLIRTHDLEFILDIANDSSDSELYIDESDSNTNWIDDIISEITANENDFDLDASRSTENMFYLPDLAEYLQKLCGRLPLWSAVMKPHFKSPKILASSSNVESNFNIIKNVIMKDTRLPVRIDAFLQKYLKAINGSTKLAIANYPNNKGILEEFNEVNIHCYCR